MRKTPSDQAMDWIAEADYCARIAASNGDSNVPAESLVSYLLMQANSAARDGFWTIAADIRDMIAGLPK